MEGIPAVVADNLGRCHGPGSHSHAAPAFHLPSCPHPEPKVDEEGLPLLPKTGAPGCSDPSSLLERSLGSLGCWGDALRMTVKTGRGWGSRGGITGGRDESLLLRLKWGQPDSQKEEHLINLWASLKHIFVFHLQRLFNNATTITKCLHTFCKNCTVRHCYSNRCPKYNIVIHQTQPLYHIRLDQGLKDIVYKLVINLREKGKCMISSKGSRSGLKTSVPQPFPSSKRKLKKS